MNSLTDKLSRQGRKAPPAGPETPPAEFDDLIQELYFAMGFSVEADDLRDRFPDEASQYCRVVRRASESRLPDSAILERLIAVRESQDR